MTSAPRECLRCKGHMEEGLVIDQGNAGVLKEQQWMEGTAEHSIWTGLKIKGRERLLVSTYRCEQCGYLESYANNHAQ